MQYLKMCPNLRTTGSQCVVSCLSIGGRKKLETSDSSPLGSESIPLSDGTLDQLWIPNFDADGD